jgi:hypothetical protein
MIKNVGGKNREYLRQEFQSKRYMRESNLGTDPDG